jgi:hypothetical protein
VYTVAVEQTVGPGLRGIVVLRVAKDRPGHVRAHSGRRKADGTQEAARVVVDSTGANGRIQVTVEPGRGADRSEIASNTFRPTGLMQAASEVLELAPGPLSFRRIDLQVKGKREYKMLALDVLVAEGYVSRTAGPHNSHLHTSVKPDRQRHDPLADDYEPPNLPGEQQDRSKPESECSRVPRLENGGGEHTQPFPGTLGEHGHTSACPGYRCPPVDGPQCARRECSKPTTFEGLC